MRQPRAWSLEAAIKANRGGNEIKEEAEIEQGHVRHREKRRRGKMKTYTCVTWTLSQEGSTTTTNYEYNPIIHAASEQYPWNCAVSAGSNWSTGFWCLGLPRQDRSATQVAWPHGPDLSSSLVHWFSWPSHEV